MEGKRYLTKVRMRRIERDTSGRKRLVADWRLEELERKAEQWDKLQMGPFPEIECGYCKKLFKRVAEDERYCSYRCSAEAELKDELELNKDRERLEKYFKQLEKFPHGLIEKVDAEGWRLYKPDRIRWWDSSRLPTYTLHATFRDAIDAIPEEE